MSPGLSTLELAGFLLSGEFALVALVVPAMLLRRQRHQVSAAVVAAESLLETVEAKEPSRRDALTTIFSTTYQFEGAELDAKIDEFIAREQAFYQVMTRVYLDRDGDKLKSLPDELTKLIAPWLRLTPRNAVDPASLSALETTNAALSAELDETRRSMADLMVEYTAAFDKGQQAAVAEGDAGTVVETGTMGAQRVSARRNETLQMAADEAAAAMSAVAARQAVATAGGADPPSVAKVAAAQVPAHDAPASAEASAATVDDLAGVDAPATRDGAAVTAAAGGIDYIDVSEDPGDVALNQDDIDALTDLFDQEIEDTEFAIPA